MKKKRVNAIAIEISILLIKRSSFKWKVLLANIKASRECYFVCYIVDRVNAFTFGLRRSSSAIYYFLSMITIKGSNKKILYQLRIKNRLKRWKVYQNTVKNDSNDAHFFCFQSCFSWF